MCGQGLPPLPSGNSKQPAGSGPALESHLICQGLHLLLQRCYLRLLPLHAVSQLQRCGERAEGW